MFTWICKSVVAACALVALTACDEATGLPFAADLGTLTQQSGKARMAQVELAGGDIVLAAPDGYCIDRRSLRRLGQNGFAVLARCDTLGVRGFYGAYDLAILTVTTAPQRPGADLPTLAALAGSADAARVLDKSSRAGQVMVRFAEGGHMLDGVSPVHWRGAFALNGHLVGIGLYAPDGSPALSKRGAALLSDLTRATRKASAAQATAKAAPED